MDNLDWLVDRAEKTAEKMLRYKSLSRFETLTLCLWTIDNSTRYDGYLDSAGGPTHLMLSEASGIASELWLHETYSFFSCSHTDRLLLYAGVFDQVCAELRSYEHGFQNESDVPNK